MGSGANKSHLEKQLSAKLDARKAQSRFRQLTTSKTSAVDFSSNDFLSLSTSPALRDAFLQELNKGPQGQDFTLGSGGSRLLDGNSSYADELEQSIAQFHGAPAGLLFNSGFDANSGFFACVPQEGDVILYDEFIHASVHDGMKLSRASMKKQFLHNEGIDLESVLEELVQSHPEIKAGNRSVFIAVESVYSMDGDIAPLKEIVQIKDRLLPKGNGHIIIDEAHGTGVLGPLGRGLVSELGLEDKVFARLHTFGKSLACSGAIMLCSPTVRSYLINYCRSLIYTTFLPFPNLAAIKASYSLLQSGQTEPLRAHLTSLIAYLHNSLRQTILRRNLVKDTTEIISMPVRKPKSPIFSLLTPNPRSLAAFCQETGLVVRAVVPPTVPTRRVRVCLHAGNTKAEIDELCERIDLWLATQLGNGILAPTGPRPEEPQEQPRKPDPKEEDRTKKDQDEEDDFYKAML